MSKLFWFLFPIRWPAQLFDFLSRSQPEPRRTMIRFVGLVVLMLGLFLIAHTSIGLLLVSPFLSVAAAMFGIFMAFIGFGLMMARFRR